MLVTAKKKASQIVFAEWEQSRTITLEPRVQSNKIGYSATILRRIPRCARPGQPMCFDAPTTKRVYGNGYQ